MFNQDGGMVTSKSGHIIREWMWSSKGKLDVPVEIWVNKFITVKISGRFAITLIYKQQPQSLKLSLAPVKCSLLPPCLPEASFPDVNPISREARKLFTAYKMKNKHMGFTTQKKDPSSLTDPLDISATMDISLMSDVAASIKLRNLQRKIKLILLHWLDHYRFAFGIESTRICKMPEFPYKIFGKPRVLPAKDPLRQEAKETDEEKEYLRYRNTFLELRRVFKPSPVCHTRSTSARNKSLG
ncbi:uncharacterized protein [Dasypus novemcinctus]|uniref:uncharacterized protein n=1 Tax=Dasypus novemcinctus TaxID=9361 RepID=UPI0039C904A8